LLFYVFFPTDLAEGLKVLMNEFFQSLGLSVLSKGNIFPAVMTERKELKSLIKKLRPISCDKKLIRLGSARDGGYLVPDDLAGIKACFSPGVARTADFELECANRGMDVFLADNSVEKPPCSHERFHFTKKFIGVTTNNEFMTLDDWVAASMLDSQDDLILQIDIEGFEYEVFLAASDKLMRRFRIIVGEFHSLGSLWNKPFFSLAARAFEKILQSHSCVHNHPNNCCSVLRHGGLEIPYITEITFFRNDRISSPSFMETFPHPLDQDNTDNPTLDLPKCWYTDN